MRWWQIIWALYILVLSGVPCEALCQDEPTSTQQTSGPASEDHDHDAACSPFCICATCSGCSLPQAPQLIGGEMLPALVISLVLPVYQPPYAFDLPDRIWQPPRLG